MKKVIILDTWFFIECFENTQFEEKLNQILKSGVAYVYIPSYTVCEFLKSNEYLIKKAFYIQKFIERYRKFIRFEDNSMVENIEESIRFLIEKKGNFSFTDIKIIEFAEKLKYKSLEVYIFSGDSSLVRYLQKKFGVKSIDES